ncbi:hypothetical protein V5N11_001819 [Cardamine amara subsp. amara]|uniref:Uncharacterized protein n=1 Tax=Cardamine amara subsp. amara TaxID=228776 RepID=A0ABD1BLA3_CARAN
MDMGPSNVQEDEKVKETDKNIDPDLSVKHDQAPEAIKPEESEEKTNTTSVSALDMDSSDVQEEEKIEETDKNIDPDLSVTHDDATEPMKPDATCVSAIDMILKSLWQITVFTSQLATFQETDQSFTEDQLHDFIFNNLSLTQFKVSALT